MSVGNCPPFIPSSTYDYIGKLCSFHVNDRAMMRGVGVRDYLLSFTRTFDLLQKIFRHDLLLLPLLTGLLSSFASFHPNISDIPDLRSRARLRRRENMGPSIHVMQSKMPVKRGQNAEVAYGIMFCMSPRRKERRCIHMK
jgi:hypothetical protein